MVIGTARQLVKENREKLDLPIMVHAVGTHWGENYCFVIERLDFWGRAIGYEYVNGQKTGLECFVEIRYFKCTRVLGQNIFLDYIIRIT